MNDGNGNGMNQSLWTEFYRNQQMARKKVAPRYNQGRKQHRCGFGDLIRYQLKLNGYKAQNLTAKLMLRWSAPVKVAKVIRPNVVLLANPDTGVIIRRAHVSQLKACVQWLWFSVIRLCIYTTFCLFPTAPLSPRISDVVRL